MRSIPVRWSLSGVVLITIVVYGGAGLVRAVRAGRVSAPAMMFSHMGSMASEFLPLTKLACWRETLRSLRAARGTTSTSPEISVKSEEIR